MHLDNQLENTMRLEGRPEGVKNARLMDDRQALRAMGRKGAESAARNRAIQEAEHAKEIENLALEQSRLYSLSPEGDVLPPEEPTPTE